MRSCPRWQVLYRAAIHHFSLLVAGAITLCLLTFYGVPLDPNSGALLAGGASFQLANPKPQTLTPNFQAPTLNPEP